MGSDFQTSYIYNIKESLEPSHIIPISIEIFPYSVPSFNTKCPPPQLPLLQPSPTPVMVGWSPACSVSDSLLPVCNQWALHPLVHSWSKLIFPMMGYLWLWTVLLSTVPRPTHSFNHYLASYASGIIQAFL